MVNRLSELPWPPGSDGADGWALSVRNGLAWAELHGSAPRSVDWRESARGPFVKTLICCLFVWHSEEGSGGRRLGRAWEADFSPGPPAKPCGSRGTKAWDNVGVQGKGVADRVHWQAWRPCCVVRECPQLQGWRWPLPWGLL